MSYRHWRAWKRAGLCAGHTGLLRDPSSSRLVRLQLGAKLAKGRLGQGQRRRQAQVALDGYACFSRDYTGELAS